MNTIPKIIHYCWFGHNELPKSAIKCINSWKKYFPDYEIKQWNEENFDINIIPYTKEAYSVKKYAFVSDYARFWILYMYGGIYFDTDVEVIRSFDDIVANGPFMGVEFIDKESIPFVAPGLGLGVTSGLSLYKEILDYYSCLHFLDKDGTPNEVTIVKHTTNILLNYGLASTDEIQNVAGVRIYPKEFFNPYNDLTGLLNITKNTHSIHWYSKSWCEQTPFYTKLSRLIHLLLGVKISSRIRSILFFWK